MNELYRAIDKGNGLNIFQVMLPLTTVTDTHSMSHTYIDRGMTPLSLHDTLQICFYYASIQRSTLYLQYFLESIVRRECVIDVNAIERVSSSSTGDKETMTVLQWILHDYTHTLSEHTDQHWDEIKALIEGLLHDVNRLKLPLDVNRVHDKVSLSLSVTYTVCLTLSIHSMGQYYIWQ